MEETTKYSWRMNPEKEALKGLIAQYTDELLKRAIERGEFFREAEPPEETNELYKKAIDAIMPRPKIILEGITLLYTTAPERANARMRQYFEEVQKLPDLKKQLALCYSMLRSMDGFWTPFNTLGISGTGGGGAAAV